MQIDRPITIALILFAVLLFTFFLVMPEYKTFKSLQMQLALKKAEYNAQVNYYSEINKTYSELQSHQDDIKKIDDALPQDPNFGKLVYFLSKTAAENGMMVKDLFLSKSSPTVLQNASSEIKDVTFSMDLMGDYPSLGRFLAALEKSARLFEVSSISFGSSSLSSALPNQSQFQIQQTYVFNLQIKTHTY